MPVGCVTGLFTTRLMRIVHRISLLLYVTVAAQNSSSIFCPISLHSTENLVSICQNSTHISSINAAFIGPLISVCVVSVSMKLVQFSFDPAGNLFEFRRYTFKYEKGIADTAK